MELDLIVLFSLARKPPLCKECNKLVKTKGAYTMPVVTIEVPPGLRLEKKRMVEKITAAIDEAYEIGDTLIFLHEDSPAASAPRVTRIH